MSPTPAGSVTPLDLLLPIEAGRQAQLPFDDAEQTIQYDGLDLDRYLFAYYLPFISAMDVICHGDGTTG